MTDIEKVRFRMAVADLQNDFKKRHANRACKKNPVIGDNGGEIGPRNYLDIGLSGDGKEGRKIQKEPFLRFKMGERSEIRKRS
jgi:hypothetical protein